jgi:hypothetical protein
MMAPSHTLSAVAVRRVGFRLQSQVVRSLIPRGVIGTYLLLRYGTAIYVGRSDACLRTRLEAHPLLNAATHFLWEPCRAPLQAYLLEAYWYHRLEADPTALNQVHPARPAGFERPCPFCLPGDALALRRALGIGLALPRGGGA